MPAIAHDTEPLLSAYHFNYTQRPRRDKAWALAYILLLLLTLGWALVSLVFSHDLLAVLSSPHYLADPNHCPLSLDVLYGSSSSSVRSQQAWSQQGSEPLGPAVAQARPAGSEEPSVATTAVAASSGLAAWVTRSVATAREAVLPPAGARQATASRPQRDAWRAGEGQRQDWERRLREAVDSADAHADVTPEGGQRPLEEPPGGRQRWDSAPSWLGKGKGGDSGGGGGDAGGGTDGGGSGGSGGRDDGPVPRVLLDYGGLLLLISLGAALVLALLFVLALRYRPWALVLLACGLQVGAPLASAMVASKAGNSTLALVLLLVAAAVAVSLYCSRKALGLVARLLGLAAVALRDNPSLLGLVMVLKTALAGATATLMVAVAVVGAAGEVVPNPLRAGNPRCATPAGKLVTCCALAPAAGLPVYLPVAAMTLAWTLLLLFEVKVFVVSGVVAQWYFSPSGHLAGRGYYGRYVTPAGGGAAGAAGAGAGGGEVGGMGLLDGGADGGLMAAGDVCSGGFSSNRAMLASLSHALGPSFGSLCAASWVLGATSYLRAVVNSLSARSRRQALLQYANNAGAAAPYLPAAATAAAAAGPCCCCCGCCGVLACLGAVAGGCCWCVTALLEQLTKYATVQMSMSGLGFWKASQEAVALMRRNFMDAYNMWWYLPMVLHCGGAFFAASWGYAAYWLARQCWAPFMRAEPLNAAAAATLGALAAAIAELVLSFVCSVLVNIADALFVCFVLDRDSGAVTWYDLHCVFATLPCCAVARAAAERHYTVVAATTAPPSYYYVPPSISYGGVAPPPPASYVPYGYQVAPAPQLPPAGPSAGLRSQLGQPVGYGQPAAHRSQQHGNAYAGGGGFWGWLRSPSGSGSGPYGMPVGGYRNDRPQYPPPAVLSPPYSDQRFSVHPTLAASGVPPPPPPFFGSPIPPS